MYINKANFEGYKKLYEINTDQIKFYNDKVKNVFVVTVGTVTISIPLSMIVYIENTNAPVTIATIIASPFLFSYLIMIVLDLVMEVIRAMNYDYLKKDYPNIDLNIDNKTLKRELIKYKKDLC